MTSYVAFTSGCLLCKCNSKRTLASPYSAVIAIPITRQIRQKKDLKVEKYQDLNEEDAVKLRSLSSACGLLRHMSKLEIVKILKH